MECAGDISDSLGNKIQNKFIDIDNRLKVLEHGKVNYFQPPVGVLKWFHQLEEMPKHREKKKEIVESFRVFQYFINLAHIQPTITRLTRKYSYSWLSRNHCTQKEWQSLMGCFQYISRCIKAAMTFLYDQHTEATHTS